MSRRRRIERLVGVAGNTGSERWMLSYSDFMTLLLALFVVLYASAKVDAERQAGLFDGLQAAFLVEVGEAPAHSAPTESLRPAARAAEPVDSPAIPSAAERSLHEALSAELESQRQSAGSDLGARIIEDDRGLVVSLASAEFFPKGGVEIPEARRAVLATLAPLLAGSDRPLQIEGHTDDQPIDSARFPSNWELSTARASAVARLFIEEHGIDPLRVSASGYAHYRPVAANQDSDSRARNRRVDIVVVRDESLPAQPSTPDEQLDALLERLPPLQADDETGIEPPEPGPVPQDLPLP